MRINESTIRRIIREEARRVLREGSGESQLSFKDVKIQNGSTTTVAIGTGIVPDAHESTKRVEYRIFIGKGFDVKGDYDNNNYEVSRVYPDAPQLKEVGLGSVRSGLNGAKEMAQEDFDDVLQNSIKSA